VFFKQCFGGVFSDLVFANGRHSRLFESCCPGGL
jgi:hypothetical protein